MIKKISKNYGKNKKAKTNLNRKKKTNEFGKKRKKKILIKLKEIF